MVSSLFSVPVAVILNKRLISQRGGIIPQPSQSENSLHFKLFINSNPSSVRYGLTLQISALRDMSKEHNVDQIPDHPAYIYFPTSSFFHYHSITPNRNGLTREEREEMEISEEQALEITRMFQMFWVKGDADFSQLRHLTVKCTGALVDSNNIPKLRNNNLECELKRIFGTIKTANEIDNACLELDCLLPATKRGTDRAVAMMHCAAIEELEVREVENLAAKKKQSTPGHGRTHEPKAKANTSRENSVWEEKPDATKAESNGEQKTKLEINRKEKTPKRPFIPAIIDGKFVSPDRTPLFHNENRSPTNKAKAITPKTSPQKYLHPHTFDSGNRKQYHANGAKDNKPSTQAVTEPPNYFCSCCHKDLQEGSRAMFSAGLCKSCDNIALDEQISLTSSYRG
jgi:hypothetical protein